MEDKCFDVAWCSTAPCDGKLIELYACGSETGRNEHFNFNGATGLLVSEAKIDGPTKWCVAAC